MAKSIKKVDISAGRTKEWDTDNWQGRSKEKVESNYKVMGYGLAIILFIGIVGTLISFISGVLA